MYFQGNVKTTPVTLENLNRGQKKRKTTGKMPPPHHKGNACAPHGENGGFSCKVMKKKDEAIEETLEISLRTLEYH